VFAIGATFAGALASRSAAEPAPSRGVTVTPTVGGPQTTFVFAFVTPMFFGQGHDIVRDEEIRGKTTGRHTAGGCGSSFEVAVRSDGRTPTGARVTAEAPPGGGWCVGTYDAEVVEISHQGCALASCNSVVTYPARILDRFSFRVT
jgi:hypothetical protein